MAKEKLDSKTVEELLIDLVKNPGRYTDDQLKELAVRADIFGKEKKVVGDVREVVGDDACFGDVLVILGAERGLWDESGYLLNDESRSIDVEFSRSCVHLTYNLWHRSNPLLVELVLRLKHGIRKIDDESLQEIYGMVSGPWRVDRIEGSIFDWRLLTLKLSLAGVLAGRGHEVQLDYV